MFAPGVFFFGVLLPITVVALIAYGVWELARSREAQPAAGVTGSGVAASTDARIILDERFARGDIEAGEYVQRRALLDGTVPSPPVDPASAGTEAPVAQTPAPSPEAPTQESVLDPAAEAPESS